MSTKNRMIVSIAKAYDDKNTALTERLESIVIPNEEPLPPELRVVLDLWGNTPIEEPEFFELMSREGTTLDDVKTMAMKNLNEDDFSALDIATLANRARYKVTSMIDEDGMYKTTPNIDKVKLPKTSQLRELKELVNSNVSTEEYSKKLFEIAGVDEGDLTTWEIKLVDDMFGSFGQAVDNNTLGNSADKTPFARYIKN